MLVVVYVAGGIALGALNEALQSLLHRQRWNWSEMVAFAAIAALVMPLVMWLLTRGTFFAPPNEHLRRRRAEMAVVRAGVLPQGGDPDEWSARLWTTREDLRWDRWQAAGIFVFVGAAVVAAAVKENGNAPGIGALGVALAVFAVVPFWFLTHASRAVDRLLAELAKG